MDNRILNKQISIDKIIEVADYFEAYKKHYDEIFAQEEERNENLEYGQKDYTYETGSVRVKYSIGFMDGKDITEYDYNWFRNNLTKAKNIKSVGIYMHLSYFIKSPGSKSNDILVSLSPDVYFREEYATINVTASNCDDESRKIHNELSDILYNSPERYDKTIKYKEIKMQAFSLVVGIILSYILYIVLLLANGSADNFIAQMLSNKYVIVFGQWVAAAVLGNVLGYWYIYNVYKPLLPEKRYAGYNKSKMESIYKDDINEYVNQSEIQFGKYYDAPKRRIQIEKIFSVCWKIVLVQIIVSIILFLILK